MKRSAYIRSSEITTGRKTNLPVRGMAALFAAVVALTGCVKDDLYDTPHPNHGKITLTTDWTQRTAGIAVPESHTACIGDHSATLSGERNTLDHLFEPGTYRAYIYSAAERIGVGGTVATVSPASGNRDGAGAFIHNAPGWFFSCTMDMAVEADRQHEFTAAMCQQVRQLTLVIEPTGGSAGRVARIEGYLSGAAGSLDFADGTHGTPSNAELAFTKITEGADAGKWTATVRLLGVAGNGQKLIARIHYEGDTPAPVSLESDLTADLSGFNSAKTTPLTLGGEIVETPAETGFTATINDWTPVRGGEVVAD